MRKRLDNMSPDELRRERAYQEEHFLYLVADIPLYKDLPKTWYGRWWRKWNELIVTLASIAFWTIVVIGVIVGLMIATVTLASAI